MKKSWLIILSLIVLFFLNLISGCQQSTEKTAESNDKAARTTAVYGNKSAPSGEDLRKLIYEQTPYQEWALWPGKGKLFKGMEPHGVYVTVYVNETALESIKNAKGMAYNSIVLKENYSADKQLASVTVMQKIKGYNLEGGDWFWVKFSPDSKVIDEGKVIMCLGCHTGAKTNDYIYTGKVTAKGTPAHSTSGDDKH
ncbi:MAG: cytochrome P460 family protein [Flavobacteriaceae bacterium]|nr:MAG: cytochrome P460 family protein [Flavobacteriaceae bacterium]